MGQETEDLIDDKKTTYLPKKERDIILFNLRKIVSDLDNMKLYITQYTSNYTQSDYNRILQYVSNNQTRAKNILWQLTGMSFKKRDKNENKNNKDLQV